MARKAKDGGVNKSQAIRDAFKENPSVKAAEVVKLLGEKGIVVSKGHVYIVKGKLQGRKNRRKKNQQAATQVAAANGSVDALATVLKVKKLAAEVGGYRVLRGLIDALTD